MAAKPGSLLGANPLRKEAEWSSLPGGLRGRSLDIPRNRSHGTGRASATVRRGTANRVTDAAGRIRSPGAG
jgi:hypothetical protein